jgi:tetratricopeptide (TPR) repeat protein
MGLKERLKVMWIRAAIRGGMVYLTSVVAISFFLPPFISTLASTLANALVIKLIRFPALIYKRKFSYSFFFLLPVSYVLILGVEGYKRYSEDRRRQEEMVDRISYVSPPLGPSEVWQDLLKSASEVDLAYHDKIEEGGRHLEKGNSRRAAEVYRAVVSQFPNAGGLRYNLGYAYLSTGRYREAAAEYHEALRLGVDKAHVYNNLGYAYRRMRKLDKALELYSESLQEFKKRGNEHGVSRLYTNLGGVYQLKGLWDKALDSYNRSAEG